ncbi:hypothetical protein [Streptomyces sp. RKAG290]|uniref:hypothetical protein n=1 Tax=Streptomyces sp. RKAG290 TaxID=2888348 RepID=UPI0020333874|nr:hypothetical protein [Streptomyces sp. RKAG290]MCM2411475.1 hypothetical protein [Streptomyces sp. RKAG290]
MTPWLTRWTHGFRTRRLSGSRTRRLLELHLAVLVVTALVSMTVLLVSYREVQNSAGAMRTRGAPAVQGVATTQLALLRAHQEAKASVYHDIDGVMGAGAGYENQLSAAGQGLSRLSDVQIDGERGRGALTTVNGLLTSYSSSMTPGSVKYVNDEWMQKEKFEEAERILTREGTGVVPRLDVLQEHQMQRVGRVSSMGALQRAGWAVAELGLLVMALTVLSALWVLRGRCGRSHDPWLLLSLLAAVALAVLPLWATTATQERLDTARAQLRGIEARAHDREDGLVDAQQDVIDDSTALRGPLAARTWQSWTYYGALGGGALIVLLPAVGICRRLNADYWRAG